MHKLRLGRYEILRPIAVGGMAELYLARARGVERFEKVVALKRILPSLALSGDAISLFLDEARLAATLHHPNIVQVFDIGEEEGDYFFAMEYVHGVDLRDIVEALRERGRPIEIGHVVAIGIGVAAGLHHAHEQVSPNGKPLGIVHRDISPTNVMVSFEGNVKVVDFGIAKATSRTSETRAGAIRGKLCYMSPEQCLGQPVDRRSDIFSVGVLLHELTTGKPLFVGESEFVIREKITSSEIERPVMQRPDCSPALEGIILRALCMHREQRYATAQRLQLALEELARVERLVVSPVALAGLLGELFGERLDAWHQAEQSGVSLADHLAATLPDLSNRNDQERNPRPSGKPAPDGPSAPLRALAQSRRGRRSVRWLALCALGAVVSLSAWRLVRPPPRRAEPEERNRVIEPRPSPPPSTRLEEPTPPPASAPSSTPAAVLGRTPAPPPKHDTRLHRLHAPPRDKASPVLKSRKGGDRLDLPLLP